MSVKRGLRGFPFLEQFKQIEGELARCRKALRCDHWEDKDLWRPVFVGVETFQRCDECGLMERWAGGLLIEQGFDFAYADVPNLVQKPEGWPNKCGNCGASWERIGFDYADGFNCQKCGACDSDE